MANVRAVDGSSVGAVENRESRIESLRGPTVEGPALSKGKMIIYVPGTHVSDEDFVPLGSPEQAGGQMLEGNLQLHGRIDYAVGNVTCGIFQCKGIGKAKVTIPVTEHATILYGDVVMTDETGKRHHFREGDSYLMKQGTTVIWEQSAPILQKSFFNLREE
jgi:uncharacterized cupin superfamily protein